MKTIISIFIFTFIFFSFLFTFSSYVFAIDKTKPLWKQVDGLTCKKEFTTNCRDHICKLKKGEVIFNINFKTNLINYPNINRSREILYKEHIDMIEHYDNRILTSVEQINIMSSITNDEYKFNLVISSHYLNESHIKFSTGKCILD